MSNMGNIIAIGGGGFGRNPNLPVIEKYIIEQDCGNYNDILIDYGTLNGLKKAQQYFSNN